MSAGAIPAAQVDIDEAAWHGMLRFAVGVTFAFVWCEALRWTPTFLAPVFTAVFLSNLPVRPPLKMALSLVVVMAVASLFAFVLATLLNDVPLAMLGTLAVTVFVAFQAMALGKAKLPALLLLICLSTIPVVVSIAPVQAALLPMAMIRSMALAMFTILLVHGVWPRTMPPVAPPAVTAGAVPPVVMAAMATAMLVPLMTVYLMFGLTDALPVLVATVMLVANFDPARSRLHALGLVAGNLGGGLLGMIVHAVLLTTPTLPFLALLLFLVLSAFGRRIVAGGPAAAVAVIACNAMLIILGASIASGPGSLSLWLTRLFQFVLASVFAVGMMHLVWHRRGAAAGDT